MRLSKLFTPIYPLINGQRENTHNLQKDTIMSESAWFDPRLTVFVIWGIFVFLFICIPSKRLVQSLLYKCGCNCCGYEEEIVPTNISGNQR